MACRVGDSPFPSHGMGLDIMFTLYFIACNVTGRL